MLDVRAINEKFVKNTSKDKDGKKIMWLKIKCLRFEKQLPGIVKFRYTHEGPYSEFEVFRTNEKLVPRIKVTSCSGGEIKDMKLINWRAKITMQ